MKRIISYIILLFMGTALSHAQQNNFDADIQAIRNNAVPDFRFVYDDYMQYAPAGVMVLMKACTYESRSSWPRMLVSDAFSTAIMAATVNGLKYTVQRPRPDGSQNNSFPSGHTATSFMSATMLHKEYGWRSPWFSIGAYTVATASGVSRILNNKHWMTDIVGGAAVGIGSVHLGYYLTDLIFKEKGLNGSFDEPSYIYDFEAKHYVAELSFGHRLFIGGAGTSRPDHGGLVSLSTDIPVVPGIGVKVRGSAGSLIFKEGLSSLNMYSTTVGGYWNFFYSKRFEFQAHASAGAAWTAKAANLAAISGCTDKNLVTGAVSPVSTSLAAGARADISAGLGASFMLDSNFKVKLFAEYETVSSPAGRPWLNSIVLGWSSAWFW